jgi:hypothetical protein
MADPPGFNNLQSNLKSALLSTTRTTSALIAEDLPFQRSLDPAFARSLDAQNARLLALAERLLASAVADSEEVVSTRSSASRSSTSSRISAPKLEDSDALERNWSGVVDVVDSLLERTDDVLDEVRGVIRKGVGAVKGGVESEVCVWRASCLGRMKIKSLEVERMLIMTLACRQRNQPRLRPNSKRPSNRQPISSNRNVSSPTHPTTSPPVPGNPSSHASRMPKSPSNRAYAQNPAAMARHDKCMQPVTLPLFIQH